MHVGSSVGLSLTVGQCDILHIYICLTILAFKTMLILVGKGNVTSSCTNVSLLKSRIRTVAKNTMKGGTSYASICARSFKNVFLT